VYAALHPGTLAGDYGFDPLGMLDPEGQGGFVNQRWLAYAEVIHGRWAMLGLAGMVAPEILGGEARAVCS